MTHKDVANLIKSIGLPFNYFQWNEKEAPELPYILFYYTGRNDFEADNTNYVHIEKLNIELYTNNKDFDKESLVEAVLESNDMVYEKEEQYIADERMYEVLYTMEVVINGKS